jgi:hypothetical protein
LIKQASALYVAVSKCPTRTGVDVPVRSGPTDLMCISAVSVGSSNFWTLIALLCLQKNTAVIEQKLRLFCRTEVRVFYVLCQQYHIPSAEVSHTISFCMFRYRYTRTDIDVKYCAQSESLLFFVALTLSWMSTNIRPVCRQGHVP